MEGGARKNWDEEERERNHGRGGRFVFMVTLRFNSIMLPADVIISNVASGEKVA